MRDDLAEQVGELIREVAQTIVLPRWRHLAADEIQQKGPGDLVTVADQLSEQALTDGLLALLPGSVVVGEEAVAADPSVLGRLGRSGAIWVVDPVDGTNNFAAGKTPFAVMVALVVDGATVCAWILDVVADVMTVAQAGGGAFRSGVRLKARDDAPTAGELTGMVSGNHLPAELRAQLAGSVGRLGKVTAGHHCAGFEYPLLATDGQQFAVFWKLMPWDHLPGALIVREAGGVVRHLDGSDYTPVSSGQGLLVAPNPEIWGTVRSALLA